MYNYKNPNQIFEEEHPEVDKYYEIAVTAVVYDEISEEYGNHFWECYLEHPSNEKADGILDNLLEEFAEDLYKDDVLTLQVEINEVYADRYTNDKNLYTKRKSINGVR